ncbi:MAG: 2-oxoacid:acceptor oxidoreductase subunit alpha, partial [Myxococcales bacterium]|nr:2-oxoacid:acceptor oxidoreductase subunit alpha [Myxococcales bacterium]
MTTAAHTRQELDAVTIRFAGDSGDGMQLTGDQFTSATAVAGNDLATLPDFPAEIRAPAGSLPGVSGFQIQFASHDIFTPGDEADVLVCMNPAALKTNLSAVRRGGMIIVNSDAFTETNLKKAGYALNPLDDQSLKDYAIHKVPIETLTLEATKGLDIPSRTAKTCKNFFALGLMYHMYQRPMEETLAFIDAKFATKTPLIAEANKRVLNAGWNFGDTAELGSGFVVPPARISPGTYRNIRGNDALALGIIAASVRSGLPVFLGAYPITPASDVLHLLSQYKHFGVRTFQAEDEIAGVCAAIGASFGGGLGVTLSSGPGIALKTEALGLAHMTELPLLVCNVQRGGPSTGLPTKTEQADLFQAIYGRNGECPIPVIAAATPADAFESVYEAARIAIKYMTPVFFLSDGYIANGAEPWKIPDPDALPPIDVNFVKAGEAFQPYDRDPVTLARRWVKPGTPGLEHRIGGLEKADKSGNISYDPDNHDKMTRLRAEKVARIAQEIPPTETAGDPDGDVVVVGWGSTYGSIEAAVRAARLQGIRAAHVHLRYLNPLPSDLEAVLRRFRKVLVPEINLGQLSFILRGKYLIDARGFNQV